jgi:hypothetical protein
LSSKTVPTPQRVPTNEQIDAFVNKAAPTTTKEPTARLSLDIPADGPARQRGDFPSSLAIADWLRKLGF